VSYLCVKLRFIEKRVQNLNTPQNNQASWDLQMGFNSAFKGLNLPGGNFMKFDI